MNLYAQTTLNLFERARVETDRRLEEIYARAPGEHKPLVRYVNDNVYSAGLTAQLARIATRVRAPGLCAALGGVKSFATYLAKARVGTSERMVAADKVPLGCVMNAVGIRSYSSFVRHWAQYASTQLIPFEAPHQLEPAFDAVSWHHAVNASLAPLAAEALAESLFAACPTAFKSAVEPRDIFEGMPLKPASFRHRGGHILLDLNVASRRPLRIIAWAAATAGVGYGGLYEYLGEQAFDPKRTSMKPLTLEAAKSSISLKDSSPSSKLAFLVGETWRPFLEKRLVEVAIGLLANHPVSTIAAVLSLSEGRLDTMIYHRTSVSIFDLEATIRRTAGHPAFEPWMKAGQDGPERLHEGEGFLLAGLLEAAAKGCCSWLPARTLLDGGLPAAPLPNAAPTSPTKVGDGNQRGHWNLLGALAEALDCVSRDPETQKELRHGVLQSPLHEDVIHLEWFAARLGYARGAGDSKSQQSWYKSALTEWKIAAEQLNAPLRPDQYDTQIVWACIHRYKEAPATPDRSRWLDFAETVLKPQPSHGLRDYRRSLAGLLKAYRAMEVILFSPEDLDTAGSLVAAAGNMVPPGADPWVITETKNLAAHFYHAVGNREAALQMLRESHDISTRFQMVEQEAATVQVMAFVQVHYGIAMEKELNNVLDKQIFLSRRMFNQVQLCRVQDHLYFTRELDHAETASQLAELARNLQGHQPTKAWITSLEGLLLLRLARFREATTKFADAKEAFKACHNSVKKHWTEVFLAVSLFADGQPEQAMPHAWAAASFFSANTHGQVRDCALQCLAAPTAAATAKLARSMVCPQAAAETLAQGQTWGAVTRTG